jgi:hypothetical protein
MIIEPDNSLLKGITGIEATGAAIGEG